MEKISFDQLPQMVSNIAKEVSTLKAMMTVMRPNGSFLRYRVEDGKPEILMCKEVSSSVIYQHTICDVACACKIMNMAKSTLYAHVRQGDIPGMKKGKKWYFYEDELAKWIESGNTVKHHQQNQEILDRIRSGIHHKPKSIR